MTLESTVFVTEQQANAVNATFATQQLRKAVADRRQRQAEEAAALKQQQKATLAESSSGGLKPFFSSPLTKSSPSQATTSKKPLTEDNIYF